ncbi:hypothetical protein POM88_042790 [Heracleum sosnowskyi]|uniref:Uncharacterized protein n=1 Tax=Heracleum sosnowskyi TaxID=360622 RepID=A0AAD8HJ45_9APIA|nr:hypothetical protein POM88_042790 [Heracleum sosnowskyi]
MLGSTDLRDQRLKLVPRGRQGITNPNHGFDSSSQWTDSGWPKFRAKYMNADEIENILRAQLADTHSNDPVSTEPHAFLKVDALGRVSFSSICRPRPLLEVDPPNSLGIDNSEQKGLEKPLEHEPMLATRVTIEDGLSLLLDADDIDRFLQFNQLPDVVLLFSSTDLMRVVCMAISRHLRFLFGTPPADPKTAETNTNLAKIISSSVRGMDLRALGACLASQTPWELCWRGPNFSIFLHSTNPQNPQFSIPPFAIKDSNFEL